MNNFNIQFGSLYCFPHRSKSCFRYTPDVSEDAETFMMLSGTVFVPLELIKYKAQIIESQKWYKLKMLLTNGEIWYTDVTEEVIEFLKLVT